MNITNIFALSISLIILLSQQAFSQIYIDDRTQTIRTGRMIKSYEEYPINVQTQIGSIVSFNAALLLGIDNLNGWVYRTSDAGQSWELVHKNPPPSLDDIYSAQINDQVVISDSVCVAIGGAGRIVRTTNRGLSWKIDSTGFKTPLQFVRHLDSLHLVVGRLPDGSLLHSSNAGASWDTLKIIAGFIPANYGIINLIYLSKNTILAQYNFKGKSIMIKTTDLGKSWMKRDVDSLFIEPKKLFKVSQDTLYAIQQISITDIPNDAKSKDVIIRSTDGGDNWHYLINGIYSPPFGLYNVSWHADKQRGFAVGGHGKIYSTVNGGNDWVRELSPLQEIGEKQQAGYNPPLFVGKYLAYTKFLNKFIHLYLNGVPEIFTSVDDVSQDDDRDAMLFPNPATYSITLRKGTNPAQVQIRNGIGVLVKQFDFTGDETTYDIKDLPQGMYSVVMKSGGTAKYHGTFSILR